MWLHTRYTMAEKKITVVFDTMLLILDRLRFICETNLVEFPGRSTTRRRFWVLRLLIPRHVGCPEKCLSRKKRGGKNKMAQWRQISTRCQRRNSKSFSL